jgi:hypothetical protein
MRSKKYLTVTVVKRLFGLSGKERKFLLMAKDRPQPETKLPKGFRLAHFIRYVDAGSNNVPELETQALLNPYYSLESYGFQLVATPLHATILLVSGPITQKMYKPLIHTFKAVPQPRYVITMGYGFPPFEESAPVSAEPDFGPLQGSYALESLWSEVVSRQALAEVMEARVAHIPYKVSTNDPPDPQAILEGLLRGAAEIRHRGKH